MAFYTPPPSLPRTPPSTYIHSQMPTSSSWSVWRPSKLQAPITPPMTTTFEQRKMHQPQVRVTTTLPPITHFDRHLPPLTPPDEEMSSSSSSSDSSSRLPPIHHYTPPEPDYSHSSKAFTPPDAPYFVDWLDVARTRPAHFIAEKTCEMICYLWFSTQSSPSSSSSYPSPNSSNSPLIARPNPVTSTLQLNATRTFVSFMQKLLETTQVSQSVIVLSLHYIYRLKECNQFTAGQAGSEFRIAVAALMMANKFLDDNTYTNKTWSEVSGIDLAEINKMEREFLLGVDFNLYVDKSTFASWLNLLKGLVMAKERDSRQWRKSRGPARLNRAAAHPPSTTGPATRTYTSRHRSAHRARSTSPSRNVPYSSYPSQQAPSYHYPSANPDASSPPTKSGSKRSAAAAFSPTSATFSQLPSKRPMGPISLRIPEHRVVSTPSHSPLEGLQSFAKMSLASASSPLAPQPTARRAANDSAHNSSWDGATSSRGTSPSTLSAAYAVDESRRSSAPQSLYFYTLSCSPLAEEEESRWRKARLRYHQPPPPAPTSYYYPTQPVRPLDVQSASASPHEHHMPSAPPMTTLPHFSETAWTRQPPRYHHISPAATPAHRPYEQEPALHHQQPQPHEHPHHPHHHHHQPQQNPPFQPRRSQPEEYDERSPIPSAPFANAGPPGVHFYPTPVQQQQRVNPNYVPQGANWTRGRQY
ncbi:hypothetical protein PLEOSDRAFT_1111204 [Pleurotus ostreatus PC15]|uniref:Cyclin-like domain-containing protein n=2 Tax=Pleurotus TaxID=5320 RepID=A0A067P1D5_PLEO1|nr:hypothetical protein CCMSSC00406_0006982 [Pleurotus cornucopiae]KDQ30207.1 hypothetical protein PLEOSDRAFT_1111204 [Pleurotus ostreatus PC15]